MTSIFNKISDYSYRKDYTLKYYQNEYATKNRKNNEKIVSYILSDECLDDIKRISKGDIFFKAPIMNKISKGEGRYRHVFCYEYKETALLSLIVRALFDKYDYIFSDNLYSYRSSRTNYDVFKKIVSIKDIKTLYALKVDVSEYDKCIDKTTLKEIIEARIDEKEMTNFLCRFIELDKYIYKDEEYFDKQAVRAGCPLTPFLENLYLIDYDEKIISKCNSYFRFNDDILIYGTKEQIDECFLFTKDYFLKKKLILNENKIKIVSPNEEISFLGMRINGDVDISFAIINNIKRLLTNKVHTILSFKRQLGLSDDLAMSFMLEYEKKLYPYLQLLFGRITKLDGIRKIDNIMQDCLRYVGSGKFNKKRYKIKYKTLQELGYVPLVSIYYKWEWKKK